MPKLYEIAEDLRRFEAAIEGGEIPPEAIADTLEALDMEADAKIDGICSLAKYYAAFADDIRAEVKILQDRLKSYQNRAERLLEYLSRCLDAMKREGFENARHKISFRKSEGVVISNEAELIKWAKDTCPEIIKTKEEISVSMVRELMTGREFPFVRIEERKNIQLK